MPKQLSFRQPGLSSSALPFWRQSKHPGRHQPDRSSFSWLPPGYNIPARSPDIRSAPHWNRIQIPDSPLFHTEAKPGYNKPYSCPAPIAAPHQSLQSPGYCRLPGNATIRGWNGQSGYHDPYWWPDRNRPSLLSDYFSDSWPDHGWCNIRFPSDPNESLHSSRQALYRSLATDNRQWRGFRKPADNTDPARWPYHNQPVPWSYLLFLYT